MTEFQFLVENGLPDGYVLSKEVVFPDHDIPIKAEINGKKVTVGTGRVDPETGIFTGRLDPDNDVNAEVLVGQIEGDVGSYSIHPFLNVSEVEVSKVRNIVDARLHSISLVSEEPNPKHGVYPIERVEVLPNGHAFVKHQLDREEDTDGPSPRFHDHD